MNTFAIYFKICMHSSDRLKDRISHFVLMLTGEMDSKTFCVEKLRKYVECNSDMQNHSGALSTGEMLSCFVFMDNKGKANGNKLTPC